MPHSTHGTVVLMGSGEMTPSMVEVHKYAMSLVEGPVRAAFIATPAGFQLNADQIAGKAVDYFRQSLDTPLEIVPFKAVRDSTQEEIRATVSTLYEATYLFAGPGSPTYAIHNWRDTPIPDAMLETVAHGGCLTFASAAALTLGRFVIPVYEVYKVGEALHWVDGLDILGHYGLDVCVVPHWNNTSGGDHDTRFCFMGEPRWEIMSGLLPAATTVLGIDEHTACILRLDEATCEVRGVGRVTVRRGGNEQVFAAGDTFGAEMLNPFGKGGGTGVSLPTSGPDNTPLSWDKIRGRHEALLRDDHPPLDRVTAYVFDLMALMTAARQRQDWQTMRQAEEALREAMVSVVGRLETLPTNVEELVSPYVSLLLETRTNLRAAGQWAQADRIRDRLGELGVVVADTPEGSTWRFSA
jgi:cyanophycinase-like exopeptidase